MLEEKDLLAIKELMDASEARIIQSIEGPPLPNEPLPLRTRLDALEQEVRLLKHMVLQMAEDIAKLKASQ